jgi:hypothetical protein
MAPGLEKMNACHEGKKEEYLWIRKMNDTFPP